MAAAARTRFLQPNNRFISQMRTTTIQMSKDNQNAPHRQMKLHISDSARPARPLLPPRQARDPANADGRPPRNARPPHAVTGLPPAARGIPPRGREGAPHGNQKPAAAPAAIMQNPHRTWIFSIVKKPSASGFRPEHGAAPTHGNQKPAGLSPKARKSPVRIRRIRF